jgi:hypothetical protein
MLVRAFAFLVLALEVAAQVRLAPRSFRRSLALEVIGKFFLDHRLRLDTLGLDRAPRRRVVARGGKSERTVDPSHNVDRRH